MIELDDACFIDNEIVNILYQHYLTNNTLIILKKTKIQHYPSNFLLHYGNIGSQKTNHVTKPLQK